MLLDHPSDEPTAIRTYIAAIQLCCARARKLDCFVASAPRNDAVGVAIQISNRRCASELMGIRFSLSTSLRATGSRECAPDDRLREAIHFTAAPGPKLDCFVASAPLRKRSAFVAGNDVVTFRFNFQTADKRSHSRGTILPELCVSLSLKHEGAGNAGCALHPRSRVQNG